MNSNLKNLMKISGFFRVLVFIITAVVLGYLIYGYAVHDDVRFSNSVFYSTLWNDASVSRTLLIALKMPLFLAFMLGIYWLQKLLAYYQQGHFFGQQAMQCYLWLIWIKLASFVLGIADTMAIGYYYQALYGRVEIELSIDFSKITTILLMLLIIYLLKAAKEIEAENKEFI